MRITDLFSVQTYAQIFARGLAIATSKELPVTSWRTGDPTLVHLHFVTDILEARETYTTEFMKGGFLDDATGDWLDYLAKEVYGVDVPQATASSPTITLRNNGGGRYYPEPGDLTFKSNASGKTFHTTDAPAPLLPGATVTYSLVSDGEGSDYTVATNEIDEMVTTLLGVVIVSSTAAQATDKQDEPTTRDQCRATLGALSPNGPPDAYEYVCRNHALTGESTITKARSIPNNALGIALTYVAGASGAVLPAAVASALAAIVKWATPLTVTPQVATASEVVVPLSAAVTGTGIPAGFDASVTTAYASLIGLYGIGAVITRSALIAFIQALAESAGASDVSVALTLPAADVTLATSEVAAPGNVVIT